MEGVGLVLNLRDSYQYPQRFETVLSVTLGVVSLFMVFFGMAGSLAFGSETQAPITLNLNSQGPTTFVKIALCFGLYLTYPIMMFPIWTIWESRNPNLHTDAKQRFLVRTGVVIGSAMVAFLMPNFGVFLSLVGSSICTLLAFVFPSYFHLHVLGDELPKWQYLLDVMVLVGGCLFGVLGTYQSVVAMLQGESHES
jgi:proton-coupled amino acid transporter